MGRNCCVCGSPKTTDISLHSFPKNSERCSKWLHNIGDKKLLSVPTSKLSSNYYVCSNHFKADCFHVGLKRRTLKSEAVPSELLEPKAVCPVPVIGSNKNVIAAGSVLNDDCHILNIPTGVYSNDNEYSAVVEVGYTSSCRTYLPLSPVIERPSCSVVIDTSELNLHPNLVVASGKITSDKSSKKEVDVIDWDSSIEIGNLPGRQLIADDIVSLEEENLSSSTDIVSGDVAIGIESAEITCDRIQSGHVKVLVTSKGRRCCVCDSLKGDDVSLHSFPSIITNGNLNSVNLARCKKWVQNIGEDCLLSVPSSKLRFNYFVCSKHFKLECFYNGRKRKTLKPDALPTESLGEAFDEIAIKAFPIWGSNEDIFAGIGDENLFCDEDGEMRRVVVPDNFQRSFEGVMKSYKWSTCDNCKERFTVSGRRRKKCLHKRDLCDRLSASNDMDPGPIPPELVGLTFVEEQLIARVHPVVCLYKIRGHQFGYSGNIINFPQDVQQLAKELPHKVANIRSIVTVRTSNDVSFKDFHVRGKRVLEALKWLKNNNRFYKDIVISEDNLNLLPEDGNVYHEFEAVGVQTDTEYESSELSNEDEIPIIEETSVPMLSVPTQNEQMQGVLDWPTIGNVPINEFKTEGYVAMAFPCLYPTGAGDLRSSLRPHEMNPSNYFKHMMRYCDERFAKHPRYRFFALNSMMRWTAITDGNVFVQKNPEYSDLTVSELKEKLKGNPNLMSKIMFHSNNLRGTKAYWRARGKELVNMVEQLGLPTVFFTLSAADLHWPDLFHLLAPEEDLSKISEARRRQLVQENPVIVDTFFMERVDSFMKLVLIPKFKVADYWFRVEYQHRGSPHVHGLLWLKDAPDVSKLNEMTEEEQGGVVEYFDSLISTLHPDVNAPKAVLHPCRKFLSDVDDIKQDVAELLNRVQRHTRCMPGYCLRGRKGQERCRFKFPQNLEPASRLNFTEKGESEIFTARNDPYLNKYNEYILQCWRANMDIAPCLSKRALINYLTKYVSKCEVKSKHFDDIVKHVFSKCKGDSGAKEAIRKLYLQACCERDYCAQEVAHMIMGSKLVEHGGREFVTINLQQQDEWVTVKKNRSGESFVEKYMKRPQEFSGKTLWQYAQSVNVRNQTLRQKHAVVQVYPILKFKPGGDNEKWFRLQVLLYVPWESENQFIQLGYSWEVIYGMHKEEIRKKNCSLDDICPDVDEDEVLETEVENRVLEDHMSISALRPKDVAEAVELGYRDVDIGYDWNQNSLIQDRSHAQLASLNQFVSSARRAEVSKDCNVWDMPNVTFTADQENILKLVRKQVECVRQGMIVGEDIVPKRIIVQGKAGTGKSLLIKSIMSIISEELGSNSGILLAPTGVAAINIGGATLHSKLHISPGNYIPLNGASAKKFSEEMASVKFLIIDEYSMVGSNLFSKVERRCREGKECMTEYFGGLFVFLFGDIQQLPPVLDSSLYSRSEDGVAAAHGRAAFDSFNASVVLTQVMRQRDVEFKRVLENISCGKVTEDDYSMLATRFMTNVGIDEVESFRDSIHLFHSKKNVANENLSKLQQLRCKVTGNPVPIARVIGKHNCSAAELADADKAGGLADVLLLAKGAKVMLRSNLWTAKGLVNGALGVVVDIVYAEGASSPNDRPSVILCQFENYEGPTLEFGNVKNLVPIPAICKTWVNESNKMCSRVQFPLALAYACTIHKAQGLTLNKVVIDIGPCERSLGLTYVALSRCTSLEGLLIRPFSKGRIFCLNASSAMKERQRAECDIFSKKLII